MRKIRQLANGIAVLGLLSSIWGCHTASSKRGPAQQTSNQKSQDTGRPENSPPSSSGELISDEPGSMAREDQQRAAQAGDQLKPKKQTKRPEPPLRPVNR